MVFFSCETCGSSVKKNQVEKHTYQCRGCHSVTCLDCFKTFDLVQFKQHNACMTEDEKYAGKDSNFVAKERKGENKQTSWFQQVQDAISNANVSDPALRSVLEKLQDYPNVPRNKKKFLNFLSNSFRVRTPRVAEGAWAIIETVIKKPPVTVDAKSVEKRKSDEGHDEDNSKKSKINGAEHSSDVDTQSEPTDQNDDLATKKKVKWSSMVRKILKEEPQGTEIKLKKIRKRLRNEYSLMVDQGHTCPNLNSKDQINRDINEQLGKSGKFVIQSERISLKIK